MEAYSGAIDAIDDVDSAAGLRLRGEGDDAALAKRVQDAINRYRTYLDTVDRLVGVSDAASAPLPALN